MASRDAEDSVYRAAKDGLRRWLGRAREAVMAPFRGFRAQPNPQAIAATVPFWKEQVDRILEALTPAIREGWEAAHLPGDVDLSDPYIQANLALTRNLLVRIPDEVHALVVAQILEGSNAGESVDQIARRVDRVLDFTGSENWNNRSRVIAVTEATRHRNSSLLAHGLLSEKHGRQDLVKQWDTTMDQRERPAHRLANDQVQALSHPFIVDGESLLFPGDPLGSADNVCNCLPPWQSVSVAMTGLMRGRFDGMLIRLRTAEGDDLTATPDHPVLTSRGWLALKFIQEGDYVLSATQSGSTACAIDPDVTKIETKIEDIVSSLQVAHSRPFAAIGPMVSKWMSATFVDLDGQTLDDKVDVIRTQLVFRFGCYAEKTQQLAQFSIHGRQREMSLASDPSPGKRVTKSKVVGLRDIPDGQVKLLENSHDAKSGDIKSGRHGHNRGPGPIEGADFFMEKCASLFGGPRAKSLVLQGFRHSPGPSLQFPGYSSNGHSPILMEIDNLVSKVQSLAGSWSWHEVTSRYEQHYSGEVYDFETTPGLFSAGGIAVSNCRCDLRLIRRSEVNA